jgi:predicted dehydrogenase
MAERKRLGIGVVGSGRIGTIRTRQALEHPAVDFVAVSDAKGENAEKLATHAGAHFHSANNREVIDHPDVNTVIVSTSEGEHLEPVLHAIAAGKSVLVEKPIAVTVEDADTMIRVAEETGSSLHIGYTRRYRDCYLRTKEQILQGRLGKILGVHTRVYNARGQGFAIMERDRHATPVVDILTYYIDLVTWFLGEDNPPVSVIARGQYGVFKERGFDAPDVTWAIMTMRDGAVVNLGVCYALPLNFPALGQTDRFEFLGDAGTMMLDDDHTDHMLYTDKGIPHPYLKDRNVNFAFLGGHSAGDWALGSFWGGMANETRSWLDHVSLGKSIPSTTPREARRTLQVTLAIEEATRTGKEVIVGN